MRVFILRWFSNMRAEMAAPYSVSALSTVRRRSCGENIFRSNPMREVSGNHSLSINAESGAYQ